MMVADFIKLDIRNLDLLNQSTCTIHVIFLNVINGLNGWTCWP